MELFGTRTMLRLTLPLLLALPLLASAGKLYKIIDEHGNVTYSDKPPAGDVKFEVLDMPGLNTTPSLKVAPKAAKEEEPAVFAGYKKVRISTPEHDQTIPPGQQEVEVELVLTPELQSGHKVQVIFDGKQWGNPVPSTTFTLTSLNRGAHTISMEIKDEKNKTVARSNSVTFHVKRPSRLLNSPLGAPQQTQVTGAPRAQGVNQGKK